jgi:hypothetical protein
MGWADNTLVLQSIRDVTSSISSGSPAEEKVVVSLVVVDNPLIVAAMIFMVPQEGYEETSVNAEVVKFHTNH